MTSPSRPTAGGPPIPRSTSRSRTRAATRSDLGSPTGYYLRRYIQESTSFTPENTVTKKHQWIVYRYAETLLTYA